MNTPRKAQWPVGICLEASPGTSSSTQAILRLQDDIALGALRVHQMAVWCQDPPHTHTQSPGWSFSVSQTIPGFPEPGKGIPSTLSQTSTVSTAQLPRVFDHQPLRQRSSVDRAIPKSLMVEIWGRMVTGDWVCAGPNVKKIPYKGKSQDGFKEGRVFTQPEVVGARI